MLTEEIPAINSSMSCMTLSLFVSFAETSATPGRGRWRRSGSCQFNYRLVASLGNGGASNHPFRRRFAPYRPLYRWCSVLLSLQRRKRHWRGMKTSFSSANREERGSFARRLRLFRRCCIKRLRFGKWIDSPRFTWKRFCRRQFYSYCFCKNLNAIKDANGIIFPVEMELEFSFNLFREVDWNCDWK